MLTLNDAGDCADNEFELTTLIEKVLQAIAQTEIRKQVETYSTIVDTTLRTT